LHDAIGGIEPAPHALFIFASEVVPDVLIIEDGATVNARFQAHTFEDRGLKMDYVHVRRVATLGSASAPRYGADIGAAYLVA